MRKKNIHTPSFVRLAFISLMAISHWGFESQAAGSQSDDEDVIKQRIIHEIRLGDAHKAAIRYAKTVKGMCDYTFELQKISNKYVEKLGDNDEYLNIDNLIAQSHIVQTVHLVFLRGFRDSMGVLKKQLDSASDIKIQQSLRNEIDKGYIDKFEIFTGQLRVAVSKHMELFKGLYKIDGMEWPGIGGGTIDEFMERKFDDMEADMKTLEQSTSGVLTGFLAGIATYRPRAYSGGSRAITGPGSTIKGPVPRQSTRTASAILDKTYAMLPDSNIVTQNLGKVAQTTVLFESMNGQSTNRSFKPVNMPTATVGGYKEKISQPLEATKAELAAGVVVGEGGMERAMGATTPTFTSRTHSPSPTKEPKKVPADSKSTGSGKENKVFSEASADVPAPQPAQPASSADALAAGKNDTKKTVWSRIGLGNIFKGAGKSKSDPAVTRNSKTPDLEGMMAGGNVVTALLKSKTPDPEAMIVGGNADSRTHTPATTVDAQGNEDEDEDDDVEKYTMPVAYNNDGTVNPEKTLKLQRKFQLMIRKKPLLSDQ